jgi:subtilase family serine protease
MEALPGAFLPDEVSSTIMECSTMHKLSNLRFLLMAAVLLPAFLLVNEPAAAQRQVLETNSAAPAGIEPIGRLPGSQVLNLTIALPIRNQDQLDTLLQQLYDPASPNYRHFLSVAQFAAQFGPTPGDYQQVVAFAQSSGLQITRTFANRLAVTVSGPVANVERAFQVTIYEYQHPTQNRTFYAPDREPSIAEGLPILTVVGLSTYNLPHNMLKKALPNADVHSNQTGSGPGGQFLGSDMRAAYGGGTSLTGAGQVVGLIELGPYRLADVLSYFTSLNQPLNVPIVNVLVGVNGICGVGCDDGEEVIDIQQAISMAPGLSAMLVYETNGNSTNALSAYTQAASDNVAKQLSISFGWGDVPGSSTGQAYEQVFRELETQGTSSFVASGDAGASLSGGYPGNSPNITDAGGTDLTTNGAGGPWQSEMGWIGSGGGWNTQSPIPSYQSPVIDASNGGDPSYRNIPDVSAEANTDNYFCANGSCQGGIGGTSLAAPRWAGFVALINQQAAANATTNGNPTLGFVNSTFYPLGQGANYGTVLHDITTGTDVTSTTCTSGTLGCLNGDVGFDAVTGFDLVTGWGTPNGPTAFDELFPITSNANFAMAASPSTLPLTAAGNGSTSSISVTPLNGFNAATNLSVVIPGTGAPSYPPAGLTATLGSSSIPAGGGPVMLNVSTTSATPGGTYVIAIVGTSGGLTQTAYVTVELPAFVGLAASPAAGVSLNQGSNATATITSTLINGFNGTVTLTAQGQPTGVTSSFTPVNATTTTMTFTASSTAPLTGANKPSLVTVNGTAADSSPQSTGVNVFVNPPMSGGSGTPVDLSSVYNDYAIYANSDESAITSTNSLDGVGFAFSASLLGSGLDDGGTQFTFGTPNQPNAIYGTGTAITLPSGIFTTLQLLATGIEGNQSSQTITVTYSDNSTQTFTQSFSDWCSALNGNGCVSTGSNPGESVAVAMPYRISAGGADNRVFYLYHYSFTLNTNKTVQSVMLPNNRDVVVLAMTLAGPVTTGFTLAASPTSVSVPQGGNNTTTVTVTSTGGFTGMVSLSASGLPNGVTAAFNPTSTSTTSVLTLTATSSATTGAATVTITGASAGVTENTTVSLNVTAPASYSLSAGAPSQGTISPGGTSQATVTVGSANGYTGSVTLSCSVAPVVSPPASCSFGSTSPVTVTSSGGTATLTFTTVAPTTASVRSMRTFYALMFPLLGLSLVGVGMGSRGSRRKRLLGMLLLWMVLASLIVIPACGGKGSSTTGSQGTPAGTYTVTITGKDANGTAPTGNSPTVTVTVN